jgi:hypothetical protein
MALASSKGGAKAALPSFARTLFDKLCDSVAKNNIHSPIQIINPI